MSRVLAAALLVGAAALGCRAEQGNPYACVCTGLTDFDDTLKQAVTICAPSASRAPGLARGCAQKNAPAPLPDCSCQPVSGGACVVGACELR